MPVIIRDPNEAVQPDFASEDYQAAHQALVSDNVSEEAAIALLSTAWAANNTAEKEIWERQRREEGELARDQERQEREESACMEEVRVAEEETARVEEKRRHKNKYTEISLAPPPTTPPEILSTYATTRLQKGLFVEMWYFTNEGLDYALKTSASTDDDTMVQTIDKDGNASWVTTAASKGAKAALDDRHLSWEQLLVAIPRFLDAIHVAGWTEQRQDMMTSLFTGLQAHPYRSSRDPLDRVALLRYLAEQRRLWHQAIDAGTGAWNIGTLSETLLRMANETVHRERRDREDVERSRLVSTQTLLRKGALLIRSQTFYPFIITTAL